MAGKLYLIPTVLSDEALHTIPAYVHDITKTLTHFFVEDERTARRYLRKSGYMRSFDEVVMLPLNEHTSQTEISLYADHLINGNDCGLMSEAGVPAVADPGHLLVKLAHEHAIQVVPLSGPSSIILALMASGLNGQRFCFHGYLPVNKNGRVKKLQQLDQRAKDGETQVFIETPYRNNALIADILQTCNASTLLCIASDLTGEKENIQTHSVREWKTRQPSLEKIPAIFLIGNFVV